MLMSGRQTKKNPKKTKYRQKKPPKKSPKSNKGNVWDQYKVIICSAGKIDKLYSFAEIQKIAQIAQVLD